MHTKGSLEILFWLLTAVLAAVVLLPILSSVPAYPFLTPNLVFVVSFVTLTRYLFLLPHTFLAKRQWLKGVCLFLCIPLAFYIIQELNRFQTFLDEQGFAALLGTMPTARQPAMGRYIRSEMLLFGVGSAISCILFPFRMMQSIWLTRNRGRA